MPPSLPPPQPAGLPGAVLAAMLRADSARPRLTFYDDGPGPTSGERVELSARVLANWVAKAGNALQEELDAAPGTQVWLDLPAHWRALYWALAAWSVGATVHLAPSPGAPPLDRVDLVVTDDPDLAGRADHAVLVSLPMLARRSTAASMSAGVMDEARELATYGDLFAPWDEPDPLSAGLVVSPDQTTSYDALATTRPEWGEQPRVLLSGGLDTVLLDALSAWSAGGSVVLLRGTTPEPALVRRIAAEGVTVDARHDE